MSIDGYYIFDSRWRTQPERAFCNGCYGKDELNEAIKDAKSREDGSVVIESIDSELQPDPVWEER